MEVEFPLIWLRVAELVALAAPAVTVALSRGTLGQKEFTIRFTVAFLLFIFATALVFQFLAVWLLLPLLALQILIVRWTSMRLNALGSDRWYALLWYITPAGFVLAILLTAKRHRKDPVLFWARLPVPVLRPPPPQLVAIMGSLVYRRSWRIERPIK